MVFNRQMQDISDWELIACAREGDEAAFAMLVRRYEVPVMHFCLRMVQIESDAEEITQDTFVRVYRHLPRLKPRARFSTFLFGVARNLTLNFLRDAKRRGADRTQVLSPDFDVPDELRRPDRAARHKEIDAMFEAALALLSPAHREVLLLRELQGFDYETIARVCHCRKGTVRSRLARAREQLRVHMIALGGVEL